jgi:SAM-dependent methyltransferase
MGAKGKGRLAMTEQDDGSAGARSDYYSTRFARFSDELAAEMRREVFGEDLGQSGWTTASELPELVGLLRLGRDSRVLDVACGPGGWSLALVERSGCQLNGLDVEAGGIAHATAQAAARGLADRATFAVADCAGRLPFEDGSFSAVLCNDAICHLRDRFGTLAEWARLLRGGGRLVFTDPGVLTGEVAKTELDIRATSGFFLFVPPGLDEAAITTAGLTLLRQEDRTATMAETAARWHAARARRAAAVEDMEGAAQFEQRQRFFATTAELARSRRLSRFLYVAEKPA